MRSNLRFSLTVTLALFSSYPLLANNDEVTEKVSAVARKTRFEEELKKEGGRHLSEKTDRMAEVIKEGLAEIPHNFSKQFQWSPG